jgi:hypothetical protein
MTNTWTYQTDVATSLDGQAVNGYDVEATDGSIGTIDEHSDEPGSGYVIVDTGFWIFGKKRVIPAGVIRSVDHGEQKVYVALTKEQVKAAPDYDESARSNDDWFRTTTSDYYDPYVWGVSTSADDRVR